MKVSLEDFRRQYAGLTDEALLDVDRADLVDTARNCYDEELARRKLKVAAPPTPHAPKSHGEAEEFAVAETYETQEEANLARELLRASGIPAQLGSGGLVLLVPASTRKDALELLEAQLTDDQLAAAAAGASYVRHGVGTVRPYLYGHPDLIDFVQEVFGAVELERFAFGLSSYRVEAAIGDSVVVLEVGDPPPPLPCPPRSICMCPTWTPPTAAPWKWAQMKFHRPRTNPTTSASQASKTPSAIPGGSLLIRRRRTGLPACPA